MYLFYCGECRALFRRRQSLVLLRVVGIVVAADRLLDFAALLDDQIGHGDHVAQFAQFAVGLGLVVKLLGLLPQDFQPPHGALEREVRADDAHVVGH